MKKSDSGYKDAFTEFKSAQRQFDKVLRQKKRSYERSRVHMLEKANTDNPTEFWRCISNMGPKKGNSIPGEVLLEDGTSSFDKDIILNKWMSDFRDLLTPPTTGDALEAKHKQNNKFE